LPSFNVVSVCLYRAFAMLPPDDHSAVVVQVEVALAEVVAQAAAVVLVALVADEALLLKVRAPEAIRSNASTKAIKIS